MPVERRQRDRRILRVIALCCFVLCGCSDAPSALVLATLKPTALPPVLRPSSTRMTTLPPGTPQPVAAALDAVTRALSANDAQGQGDALNGQWRIDARFCINN